MVDARVPAERITLIPHGIEASRFPVADATARATARAVLGLKPEDLVAGYVGRLDDPKNEDWLLDLAAQTRSSLPRLRILIAGDGPHEPIVRQRVVAENLSDRVRLLGRQDDPLAVYHACDALLLPSAREGFSLACAEAMCAGVPVLRTNTAGTAELIVEDITGRSVQIDRSAFLAAAERFLSDPEKLSEMGRAAARHIREHFTLERQVSETIRLYERLAGRGS
jgi:glycosyltransferase involved in cell wall biosynthesis